MSFSTSSLNDISNLERSAVIVTRRNIRMSTFGFETTDLIETISEILYQLNCKTAAILNIFRQMSMSVFDIYNMKNKQSDENLKGLEKTTLSK